MTGAEPGPAPDGAPPAAGDAPDPATDSAGTPWAGRDLRPNPFAGDDGSADPVLARALADHAGTGGLEAVVQALGEARVLVPVLAQLEAVAAGAHGEQTDAEASSGVVALQAPDGRRALPVFTSVDSMRRWDERARPVPVEGRRAALSAVSEDWALLVLDPAGPASALVPRPAVWALAQGRVWRPAVLGGAVDPEIAEHLGELGEGIEHVARMSGEPGRTAELAVVLAIDGGLDRSGLDAVLTRVQGALGASELIAERVDSLELRVGRA